MADESNPRTGIIDLTTEDGKQKYVLPTNIPITKLEPVITDSGRAQKISADDLFLISQKYRGADGESEAYVSRSIKYKELCTSLSVGLGIPEIRSDINELSDKLIGQNTCTTNGIPYVISSVRQNDVKAITSFGQYNLSVGMQDVFNKVKFDKLMVKNLSAVNLSSDSAKINNLTAVNEFVTNLTAVNLSSRDLTAVNGNITNLTTQNLTATNAHISDLTAVNISSTSAQIYNLCCHSMTCDTLCASQVYFEEAPWLQQEDFIGNYGEVVYVSPNGMYFAPILSNRVLVCENDDEVQKCLNSPFDFRDVFYDWSFASMNGNYQYPMDGQAYYGGSLPGRQYWSYDAQLESIRVKANTTDWSFFVSKQKYSKYEILVWMRANNDNNDRDDDYILFAASYGLDDGGKHHILEFLRTPNKQNYESSETYGTDTEWVYNEDGGTPMMRVPIHWSLQTDRGINGTVHGRQRIFSPYAYNSKLSDEYGPDDKAINAAYVNASNYPDTTAWCRSHGTLLSVSRDGNIIRALTTKFNFKDSGGGINGLKHEQVQPNVEDLDYLISVDLDNIPAFNSTELSCLKNSGSIGFGSMSQTNAFFKILSFKAPQIIYNAQDGTLKEYGIDDTTGTNINVPDKFVYMGVGQITHNPYTKKTFYIGSNGVVKIGEYYGRENWEFTLSTSPTTTTKITREIAVN